MNRTGTLIWDYMKSLWKKTNTRTDHTICRVSLTAVYCHQTDEWIILLPLLGGGAPGTDQSHDDDHDHSDGSHGNHNDDQEVAVLLRRSTAVRWTHLTNRRLWNKNNREPEVRKHKQEEKKMDIISSVVDNVWNCTISSCKGSCFIEKWI